MKTSLAILCLAGLAAPLALLGQTSIQTSSESLQPPTAGLREFTLGGSGTSNKDFDDSQGGIEFSYGSYLSPVSAWALRQSFTYVNPDNAGSSWNGSTRLAYDYHFSDAGFSRPFIGASAGRVYGDAVQDSWTAGLEVGSKFFVRSQTFIYALVSYDWLFDRGHQIDDRFDDGRLGWNLGIGYQF